MKKTRFLGIVLAVLAMIFAFAACGEEDKKAEVVAPGAAPAPAPPTPLEKMRASNPAETALLDLLPEDTQVVAKFGSVATLHERLAVTDNSVLGFELESRDIEEMKEDLGFSLLSLEEMKAAGIDTTRPFCVAFSHVRMEVQETDETAEVQETDETAEVQETDETAEVQETDEPANTPETDEPADAREADESVDTEDMDILLDAGGPEDVDFDVLALLPVSDTGRVFDTVRAIFEKNSMPYEEVQEGKNLLIKWGEPDAGYGCLTVDEGFLHIAGNRFEDPQPFLLGVLQRSTSLTGSETFMDVAVKTDLKRDVFIYGDASSLKETVLSQVRKMAGETGQDETQAAAAMEALEDFVSIAMTADFGETDLNMDVVLSLAPDSTVMKMRGDGGPDRRKFLDIPDPAVLLGSTKLDFTEYYKIVTERYPEEFVNEFRATLEEIRQAHGIDVEKELIDNLGGSINLGMYDGASVTMFNYNTVFEVGVKDEEKMKGLIDKALALLPPERQGTVTRPKVGETDAYALNLGFLQIYAAVKDGRFLVGTSKPIFEKALDGVQGQGFVTKLSDDHLKKTLTGDADIYYWNIDELVRILKNFAPMLMGHTGGEKEFNDIVEVAGKFHYILSSSKLEGDLATSSFKLKTRYDKPFLIATAELVKHYKDKYDQAGGQVGDDALK